MRRHFICEPSEVREFIRSKTIKEFRNSLLIIGFEKCRTDTIIKNFDFINKYLSKVSPGFDDFFIFDDYAYFSNYRSKTLEYLLKKYLQSDKSYKVISKCLNYLDIFYKNRDFFIWVDSNQIYPSFIEEIRNELTTLFEKMDSKIILSGKLYSRMSILHKSSLIKLGKFNNADGLYTICSVFLKKDFFYSNPYIFNEQVKNITNDQIIEAYARTFDVFPINDINQYIETMHLKKLDSYLIFIFLLSDEFIQISQDVLVAKEKMNIDDLTINDIKNGLAFLSISYDKWFTLKNQFFLRYLRQIILFQQGIECSFFPLW